MSKNVLVLNMGMKSIRCIIFDSEGNKLASSALPIKSAINDNLVEQDPNEWWEKGLQVMKNACYDAKLKHIDYMTVTTSASCLVCINKKGETVGRAIMVSDKRATKEVEYINDLKEFKTVLKDTGLSISVSLLLPKILWIKNNRKEEFDSIDSFLTSNDFLLFKMCGEKVTDYLNAAKYHYDIKKETYPTELLNKLGIDENKLPKVVNTGVSIGAINKEVAKEIGVDDKTEIVITSYDAICSFVGSGVSEEGDTVDVSGTVTVFRTLSKKNNILDSKKIYNVPFKQDNFSIVGGSNNLGGGLIEWVKQCYYTGEQYPYEVMEMDASESTIGARGVIFLPYLLGERAPIWNDSARGVFFGLERMHTRKDMTRAVFESAAFIDKTMVEAIEETGVNVGTVRLSGGLARTNLVSQIKADVLGKDVLVLSEFETTSSGAAIMVLHGQGVYKTLKEAAEKFISIRMVIKPNEANHKKYGYIYELFKETYKTCEPLFIKRQQIMQQIRQDREIQIENL